VASRHNLAKLRGLADEKGYRPEKAPISGTWFLIDAETGELAMSERGTTAFITERAISFCRKWKAACSELTAFRSK
jgi:hypothetical protein